MPLQFMKEKYARQFPSLVTFASGPSRTADIEKTLVTGVHGPKSILFLQLKHPDHFKLTAMPLSVYQLFVYGSLRSGFRNPAYQYLACNFRLLGEAVVKGKFYDKGDYPVAIPTSNDAFITGELCGC
jgi:hypothetical protein